MGCFSALPRLGIHERPVTPCFEDRVSTYETQRLEFGDRLAALRDTAGLQAKDLAAARGGVEVPATHRGRAAVGGPQPAHRRQPVRRRATATGAEAGHR